MLSTLAAAKQHGTNLLLQFDLCQAIPGVPPQIGPQGREEWRVLSALQYVSNLNENALKNLAGKCKGLAAKAKRIDEQRDSEALKEWIVTSLSRGGKAVHTWTSQRTKAPPLPPRVFDPEASRWLTHPQDQAEYYARYWDELWQKRADKGLLLKASLLSQ